MSKTKEILREYLSLMKEIEWRTHAIKILSYDLETAAPEGGREDDSSDMTTLDKEVIALERKSYLLLDELEKEDLSSLDPYTRREITLALRDKDNKEKIPPSLEEEMGELFNSSYITWLKAKQDKDFEEFKPSLEKIAAIEKKVVSLREPDAKEPYDVLFSDYEYGFTTKDLDPFFEEIQETVVPLLKAIRKSSYVPRHDFLTRIVPIAKQEEFTKFLLAFNGFDFRRGSVSTTEHPFTEQFGKDDVRVTTKYSETAFVSNMYSIIHEGGHALFGQNIPSEVFSSHLGEGSLTMAKHESVSRFYENVIGRSKAYIHAIYPRFHELFKEEMNDVSEEDLYEGVNYIDLDNRLRTEADELTYSLHIIIRYQLEKEMMKEKNLDFEKIKAKWNSLYEDLLGVKVRNDQEGILQDVHWASGFGYFPTYALGNALNILYFTKMNESMDVYQEVSEGHMDKILSYLRENVFAKAPLLDTKEWIKEVSGREFSATPYCQYLKKKFTSLYHLDEQK